MTNQTKIVLVSITMIIAAGLLALNPSNMIGYAQGQMYGNYEYGYENNHPKKSSHGDIQKISCVNSNINVNGIDITEIPEDNTALAATNEGAAADASNSQNGNGFDKINFDRNLVNICVNVNDNEQQVSPPETTLTVAKQIDCKDEIEGDCEDLLSTKLDESDFLFQVTGNNANPSSKFPGSISGTVVTLNPGDYEVSEDIGPYITEVIDWIQSHPPDDPPRQAVLTTSFTGDCDESTISSFISAGTITAGDTQTCTAINSITIFVVDASSISSSSVLKINGESFPVGN